MKSRRMLILGVLALLVYLPGLSWGVPHATGPDRVKAWGVDDETPMGPLAEVHHIVFGPAPDRNLGYPLMHPFTVGAAYAPYLGFMLATGAMSGPSADFPFGFEDPVRSLRTLTRIAHFVSVLAAVLFVLSAAYAARELWDERTGVLAGLFALTVYPMFFYARTANVDALQMGLMAACLAAFARWIARDGDLRGMIGIGVFGGFALATKEPIAACFLVIPFGVLALQKLRGGPSSEVRRWDFWRQPVIGVAVLFVAFGLGSGLFVDPERFFAHLEFASGNIAEANEGGTLFAEAFPKTLDGNLALLRHIAGYVFDSVTLPGALLALLGMVWVAVRNPRAALLAVPTLTYLLVLFFGARTGFFRYVMPAVFPLGLFAARAMTLAADRGGAVRWGVTAVGVLALGLGALRGVDLTHAMIQDSRYEAGVWLDEVLPEGGRLEYFGPTQKLPPLRADVIADRGAEYLGGRVVHPTGPDQVTAIGRGWEARRPDVILVMPDYTSPDGAEHSSSMPPATFDALMAGAYGYTLERTFRTPRLLPWVRSPELDYWLVNPPIRVFRPNDEAGRP